MSAPSPARVVATRALLRVAEDGAWAAPVLDAELERAGADPRDAALATEILYGTLRSLTALDDAVSEHLARKSKLDSVARASLRAGAYQLLHLGGAPPRAIVDDQVEIVRRARGERVAGFVNALLRKIARARPERPEPPREVALPAWLSAELVGSLGEERARAFGELRELPPPIGLRVVAGRVERDALVADIESHAPRARARLGEASPLAVLVRRGGDPHALTGYAEGRFVVQEQGAQVVALLAGAAAGERVLDACAGRGQKTALLRERVGERGSVVAADLHEPKLERLAAEIARLGLGSVETRAIDLTVGAGGLEPVFDRVLVDAPCTGLGTLHRRPEILLRTGEADPARMAETQRAILRTAAGLVRPGGVLVYAVCSPLAEEGARVVASLPNLAVDPRPLAGDPVAADTDGFFRIGPWTDDCDAYQIARLRVGGR